MYKYRVSVDDVEIIPAAKSDAGFSNMDIRFLITDKVSGAEDLSLFRTVFPPGFSAHQKHYHKDIEEVMFGIRGRGVVGIEDSDGKAEEYEISPGVAVFVPGNAVHWYNGFVELWKDADPELQPQVDDVRERIARLAGEPRP